MTEENLKDALQDVKLSEQKKTEILKKIKMQKGQKVSVGRREKLALATVGFACVIGVGLFYSLEHLTEGNPSGKQEELQVPAAGGKSSGEQEEIQMPAEEENAEDVAEEMVVWKVQDINKKEVMLSKCKKVGVSVESGNTIYEAEEDTRTYAFSKDCLFILNHNKESAYELTRSNKRHNSEVSRKEFCAYMISERIDAIEGDFCGPLVQITMEEGKIVRIEEVYIA